MARWPGSHSSAEQKTLLTCFQRSGLIEALTSDE